MTSPGRPGGEPDRRSTRIAHLLVVSGPSGAGKSTFIRQLLAESLPPEIRSRLPPGCEGWLQVDGNEILKRGLSLDAVLPGPPSLPGAVVHYDIVHIHRVGFRGGYGGDPASELFARADRITIADIRPARERLVEQLSGRTAEQSRRKGWLRTLWRTTFHVWLRRLRQRLTGETVTVKTSLYADQAWLAWCYGEWETFLRTAMQGRAGSSRIIIVPVGGRASEPAFELASG